MEKESTQFVAIDVNIYLAIYNGVKHKFNLDDRGEIVTFNPVSNFNNVFYENLKEKIKNETSANIRESFLRDFLYQHEIHNSKCTKSNETIRYVSCKIYHNKIAKVNENNLDGLCLYAFSKPYALWRLDHLSETDKNFSLDNVDNNVSLTIENNDILNNKENLDYHKKTRHISLDSFKRIFTVILTLLLIGLVYSLSITNTKRHPSIIENNCKFSISDTTYLKILILPFKPDIKCKELDIDYKSQIIERLSKKKMEEGLSIKILFDLCSTTLICPTTIEDANKLGEVANADIVIWGSYEENSKGISGIRIKYQVLSNFYVDRIFRKGDTEMKSIKDLYQLRSGYLQNDIDYTIYWFCGILAHKQRNYKEAAKYFNLISSKFNKHKYEYETDFRLAEIYYDLLIPDSSIAYFQAALSKMKRKKIFNDKIEARINVNFAANYIHKGDFVTAEKLLNRAMTIQTKEQTLPENDLSKTYKVLGHLRLYKGDFSSALKSYKESLRLSTTSSVKNYYDINTLYLNISNTFVQQNVLDSALHYVRKVLLDEENCSLPMYCQAYNSLGSIYGGKRMSDSAIHYYRKSLKIQEKIFYSTNPLLVITYANMGTAYSQKGDFRNAIKFFEMALSMRNSSNNRNDLIKAYLYSNIGSAYVTDKKYNKAIDKLLIAENIANSLHLVRNHRLLGDINLNIAEAYSGIGNNSLAKIRIRKAIDIYKSNNFSNKLFEVLEAKRIFDEIERKIKYNRGN